MSNDIPASPSPRIALVGHCVPDSYMLTTFIRRAVPPPGAVVERINDEQTLLGSMASFDLLLINRALDGEFGPGTGNDLIVRLGAGGDQPRPVMMLVSNLPEAQAAAVVAGASPGFGKGELGAERSAERLRAALGR